MASPFVAALVALAVAFTLLVSGGGARDLAFPAPSFLTDALGPPRSAAPLVRSPARGVEVTIGRAGYTVRRDEAEVSLVRRDEVHGDWTRFAHGVSRETSFGRETITVDGTKAEEFLTVERRLGKRSWSWKLAATGFQPRLRTDGSVEFLVRGRPADLRIAPVAVLDASGKDITPDGVRWSLAKKRSSWWLELRLDDSQLPLPYVIDPAVDYPSPLYLSNLPSAVTSPLPGAWKLIPVAPSGLDMTTATRTSTGQGATGYWLFKPGLLNLAEGVPSSTPTGTGWIVDTAGATGFPAGDWSFTVETDIPVTSLSTGKAVLAVGAWKGTVSGGSFTATQTLLSPTDDPAGQDLRRGLDPIPTTAVYSLPKFALQPGEKVFVEYWRHQVDGIQSATDVVRQLDFYVNDGVARIAHPAADDEGPTHALAVAEGANPGGQHFDPSARTVYYNPAAAGDFTVTDALADSRSGPYSVTFPAASATGFSHAAVTDTTAPYRSNAYSWTTANTASPGTQTITGEDNALQTSTTTLSVTLDAAGPGAFSPTAPAASAAIRNGASVSATPTDAGSGVAGVEFRYCAGATCTYGASSPIGSDAYAPYSVSWTGQPADGTYTILARARDNVGNTTDSSTVTVTVDNSAPDTTVTAGPPDQTNATAASFSFSSGEAESTFACRLDEGAWASCTAPKHYSGLAEGAHLFEVRATDAAGNTDASAASRTWTIDTAAPETTIDAGPSGTLASSAATFAFSSSEAASSFQCRLDEGAWGSCASPKTYSALGEGSHSFEVRAIDAAGNTDATAASRGWSVDTTAPVLVSSTPADGATVASATSIELVANEEIAALAGATLDGVALASASVSGTTVSFATGELAHGMHALAATLEDGTGNRASYRLHFSVWDGSAGDTPPVAKNTSAGSDTTVSAPDGAVTLTVPAGAWSDRGDGDWLVVRLDSSADAPAASNSSDIVGRVVEATTYWALAGGERHEFDRPLEIVVEDPSGELVPATLVESSWRRLAPVPTSGVLPAEWSDGFYRDGSTLHVLTRHLSFFALLRAASSPPPAPPPPAPPPPAAPPPPPPVSDTTVLALKASTRPTLTWKRRSPIVVRTELSAPALVRVTLASPTGATLLTSSRALPAGMSMFRLRSLGALRKPGRYTIRVRATATGATKVVTLKVKIARP